MQLFNWSASVVFRHLAGFKGTATRGHRDGRIVEEGRDVAVGAADFGKVQIGGGEALAAWCVLGIAITGVERDRRPALGLA